MYLYYLICVGEPTKFVPLIAIGSVSMVTGQSLVLYSRLHLVLHNQFCLRLVLVLIITTAFTLHVPNIVLIFYSQAEPGRKPNMMWPWILYENFQATGFCVQELIISALYIKNLLSFFPLQEYLYDHKIRKIRHYLLSVNIMLILLDVLALLVGYFALHIYEKSGLYWKFDVFYSIGAALRAVVYSVKLKVEFSILNSLVDLTHHSTSSRINLSQGDSRKDTCPGVPLDNIDCRTQNQAARPYMNRHNVSAFPQPLTRIARNKREL